MAPPDIPQLDTDARTLGTVHMLDTVGMNNMLICLPVTPTAASICHGAQLVNQLWLHHKQNSCQSMYPASFCFECIV